MSYIRQTNLIPLISISLQRSILTIASLYANSRDGVGYPGSLYPALTIRRSSTMLVRLIGTIKDLQTQILTKGTLSYIRISPTLLAIIIVRRGTLSRSTIVLERIDRGLRQARRLLLSRKALGQLKYQYTTLITRMTLRTLSTISPGILGRTQRTIYIRTRSNRYTIVQALKRRVKSQRQYSGRTLLGPLKLDSIPPSLQTRLSLESNRMLGRRSIG